MNWKRLFSEQSESSRTGKFIMTSERTKPDAIKVALEIYRLKKKYPEKDNLDIVIWIDNNKIKTKKMEG